MLKKITITLTSGTGALESGELQRLITGLHNTEHHLRDAWFRESDEGQRAFIQSSIDAVVKLRKRLQRAEKLAQAPRGK